MDSFTEFVSRKILFGPHPTPYSTKAPKPTTTPELEVIEDEEIKEQLQIIIYNDDVNTFQHVIESLMEICKHELEQAEQCAWIIHTKGKCSVKRGDYNTLRPMCEALLDRKLSAIIE